MQSIALDLSRVSADDAIDADHLLGVVTYCARGHDPHPASFGVVPMPVLSDEGVVHSAWLAKGPFSTGSNGNLQYRYDGNVLFGFIALNETDFQQTGDVSAILHASHTAYTSIFETMEKTGFRFLTRCWNYLPRINDVDNGLERYRQFNIGRQDAFIAAQRSYFAGSPSASALGTVDGRLIVYFLATHAEPLAIENPRQLSAYHYPDQYGPRSPTFSRAALLPLPGMEALFISGTASIVGHETMHRQDIAAQTAEALRNVDTVVAQANLKSRLGAFKTRDLSIKVFLRHKEGMENVAHVLREHLGDNIDVTWLQADICREELLVEIEAFGFLDEVSA